MTKIDQLMELADDYANTREDAQDAAAAARAALLQALEAALYAAPQPAIPAGWVLAPVEPTREMVAALGFGGDLAIAEGHALIASEVEAAWGNALAAAPKPPAVAHVIGEVKS